jgi:hypothetical protein
MKLLGLTLLALLLALLPVPARAQQGPLLIAQGEVVQGDVATFDRPILVQGVVMGDVTSWSGAITVEGAVGGDVVSYAGSIQLGQSAKVAGNVLALAGGAEQHAGAQVAGQLLGDEPIAGGALVASVATILGRPTGAVALELPRPLVSGATALLALLLTVACAALWPRRTTGTAMALGSAPLPAAALGVLTTLLLALALPPLASLLALSLIGLPLLLPLLLALQLPYLFGLAALSRRLAERLGWRGGHPARATAVGALLLLLPLALVGAAAPLASAAIFYLVSSVGLGAAILSRAGAYSIQRA